MATRARLTVEEWEAVRDSVLGPILARMTGATDAALEEIFSPARDGGEWALEAANVIGQLDRRGLLGGWSLMDLGQGTIVDRLAEMARVHRA